MLQMETVIISYIISNAICAMVIASLWYQNRKRFAGLGFWLADFVLQFVALLLNVLRGRVPDFLTIVGSNSLIIGGTILLLVGLEQFVGKRSKQFHNIGLLAVFIGVHFWFTFIAPSLQARTINLSLGLLVTCAQCAWLLLYRAEPEMRSIARNAGIIFSVFALLSIARILIDLAIPIGEDFFHSNIYDTALVLTYQMLFIVLTFSLFLMVNRKLTLDLEEDISNRRQAEAALLLSEEKFFKAFHSSPDAILISRLLDGKLIEVNEGFSLILGYSREEALTSSSIDLRLWADPQDRDSFIRSLQKDQRVHDHEYGFRTKQGIIGQGIFAGEIIELNNEPHVLTVVRDVTEQKQGEEALRKSESRYRSLFENMLSGYAYCQMIYEAGEPPDFIYLEVNQAFEALTGLKNVRGKRVSQVIPGIQESDPELFETYQRVANSGKPEHFESYVHALKMWFSISVYSPKAEHFVAVFENITERKQADEELRKLSRTVEQSQVSVMITDTNGMIEYVNPKFSEVTGYSFEEVRGQNPRILRSVGAAPEIYKTLWRTISSGGEWRGEFHNQKKNGELFWDSTIISPIINEQGFITHFVAVKEDITERKYMEAALQHRNEVLAALHQTMLELVNRYDVGDILQTLLAKTSLLLNAPQVSIDLVEKDVLVTYAATPGQPLQVGDIMRRGEGGWLSWQAVETGQPAVLEDYSAWSQRRDLYEGFPIHAIAIIPILQRDLVIGAINFSRSEPNQPFTETDIYVAQQLAQMVALVLDNAHLYAQLQAELVERKRAEEALLKLAALEERQRLGRNLHDSVNQSIHSLVLFSETLVSALEKNHAERARQIAERLQESARQALKEMRLMLYEMQSTGAEGSVDLLQGLEKRLATVERRAGVRAQIIQEGSLENCPQAWQENLFWITIEALNNALKHAQARSVQIILRSFPQSLELEIVDNGIGFDLERPHAGGLGLRTMRERAQLLSGELFITSTAGKGSSVRFCAEIKAQA